MVIRTDSSFLLYLVVWWCAIAREHMCHEEAVVICVVFTWRNTGKAQARIPRRQGGMSFIVHLVVS